MLTIAKDAWRAGRGPHDPALADRPILPLLRAFATRDPGALAVAQPGLALDRAAFWRGAMARGVAAAATPAAAPVGILLPAGVEHAASLVGCLAAGRLAFPIDPSLPPDRRAALARAAGIQAAFGPPGILPPGCVALHPAEGELQAEAPPGAPALVSATSGSSGAPKLVVHNRRALAFQAWGNIALLGVTERDRLVFLGGHASVACAMHLLTALLAGGAYLAWEPLAAGPSALPMLMTDHRATLLRAVPTLARSLPRMPHARHALAAVRAVRLVGEALPADDVAALRAVLPQDARLIASYSATETIPFDHELPPARGGSAAVPSGRLRAGGAFVLLDAQGHPCPPGTPGEVVIRSRYNAMGEWVDGACVPGRMAPDAADPESRIYRTGDLAMVDADGLLRVLGRIDRQVKVNGNRVDPAEVEAALRALPGVADAAVLARQAGMRTELVAVAATAASAAALRPLLAARLPGHAVPARIITLPSLPLLPGGKPDLQALGALADIAKTGA
ncbi:AMP-binding protein [Roseomonas sp. CECT 9278]|uniref:AMP-binding protein n=1 Tax=Roseomonas sp. CECT 9278 TaxID=2845823 RepID=UPI001E4BA518|nr:AMP-binding protein [Roseomonas sp. CECT 9278]CAH0231879.1 Plipastatin synthase subunit D [Roseomonas sp. CECT 9278]